MKIYGFTEFELDYFRKYCNFTEQEKQLFELRADDVPLETCAERLNVSVSTVKRWSRRVNNKIIRVI